MGKNVAVFVDVANIFYAAKAAGVDIDYVTLLKSASAGRDLVRAYAYTGLDPDNENQRNFHDFLRRSNYKVVSKDIRKYGDGKIKANLDIELVVDMMKTARNLDIAIVVSGDGDFAPAIRAVQEMGVRCEVISFRGNTSSDLIEAADQFTDIIQLARVEKGSRSGRRVADDEADLSMTEVPDKMTEGTGMSRSRGGRGRGRSRFGEPEPVAAGASRGRGGRPSAFGSSGRAPIGASASVGGSADGGLMAMPGERLSKAVGSLTEADLAAAEVFTMDGLEDTAAPEDETRSVSSDESGDESGEGGRRRRRRGGRGRGRGRGRDEGAMGEGEGEGEEVAPVAADADSAAPPVSGAVPARRSSVQRPPVQDDQDEDVQPVAPRGPRTTPFGSFWDSQPGTPVTPAASSLAPLLDDEDFDEPEIPEYLIAEQRRGQAVGGRGAQGGRGGPRGGRSAYQSAMERERYGRGGGGGGINRYPDVSGRTGRTPAPASREERPFRPDRDQRGQEDRNREAAPRSSNEPWSEVPPELEAMLRAQVAQKPVAHRAVVTPGDRSTEPEVTATVADSAATPGAAPKRRSTRTAKVAVTDSEAPAIDEVASAPATPIDGPAAAAPKRRATRTTKVTKGVTVADAPVAADVASDVAPAADTAQAAPMRRSTRTKALATSDASSGDSSPEAVASSDAPVLTPAPAPRRRAPRKSTPAESA